MNFIKAICQDLVIIIGLWLVLNWTGAKFEWYQWIAILIGYGLYGWRNSRAAYRIGFHVGHDCGQSHPQKSITLSKEEFDAFVKENGIELKQVSRND